MTGWTRSNLAGLTRPSAPRPAVLTDGERMQLKAQAHAAAEQTIANVDRFFAGRTDPALMTEAVRVSLALTAQQRTAA